MRPPESPGPTIQNPPPQRPQNRQRQFANAQPIQCARQGADSVAIQIEIAVDVAVQIEIEIGVEIAVADADGPAQQKRHDLQQRQRRDKAQRDGKRQITRSSQQFHCGSMQKFASENNLIAANQSCCCSFLN